MISEKNEWRHLGENAIAANPHPTMGGIIDKVMKSNPEEWFVVFNHPDLPLVDGLSSKAEAFEIHEKTLADLGITE